MTQPKQENGPYHIQPLNYTPLPTSPTSSASPASGLLTPRASSAVPAPGIALRPSTLAPTTTAPNGFQPCLPSATSGPMTGSIAVPARPKPGRKAATDEPDNKRKAQNRAAQRAFRERKTQTQKSLEHENNQLKAVNDTIMAELTSLRAQSEHDRMSIAALQKDVADATARENESRAKWENNLNSMTAFPQQRQDAEAKVEELLATNRRYQEELQRMTLEINMHKTRSSQLPDQFTQRNAGISLGTKTGAMASQVPIQTSIIASQVPQKRQLATDGCGNCEENGACPCVDSYVDDTASTSAREALPLNRNPSTASMSITNLLSPPHTDSSRKDSQDSQDVPELTSDQSSPEELEIDFTHFRRIPSNMNIQTSDKCGFCYDTSNCICADNNLSLQPVKSIGPPVTIKPGTCLQCQQNPEQKAYCESLALQTKTDREAAEGQPDLKRSRIDGEGVSIGCADAYTIFKQHSSKPSSGGHASFDEVYSTFMKSNSGSRRGTNAFANDIEPKPRQFSAYETNIAAVLATLNQDFRLSNFDHGRKTDIPESMTPQTRQLKELPKPQLQMMDIQNIRRPSTAPGIGGLSLGDSMSGMQWSLYLPNLPPTSSVCPQFSTPGWETFPGPATPSILTTAFNILSSTGSDLCRYSLSIPNSAPASPGGRNSDVAMNMY